MWSSTTCLRFLVVLGLKPGTQRLLKMLTRAAFVGGGRPFSGGGLEEGDVVVGSRGFLGFELGQSWRSSVRGGRPQGFEFVLRLGSNEVLNAALVGTVSLSSWKVLSLHSRSGSPCGWVQVLRKGRSRPTRRIFVEGAV